MLEVKFSNKEQYMTFHSALHTRIQKEYMAQWMTYPDHFPESKRQFSYIEKRIWEIKFNHFLRVIKKEFKYQKPNKTRILERSKVFFEENLAYPHEQLTLIFSNEMLTATKDFFRKAWAFDSELSQNEIFQALRNVWVMLGLQSFFGKEIKITPSLLAYSLLYPYTDNLIDSPTICKSEKLEFCKRFALRLDGKPVEAMSQIESRIFNLVEMIESEFERETHPELFESLLAIHNAQTQSLKLVSTKENLSEDERFQICIDKGATSVIADGFLVMGNLDEKQHHFLYEYGAYLQILDDLQDARDDYEEGIMTYFSKNLSQTKLDHSLCKTYYLGKSFYQNIEIWYPNQLSFKGLIERSFGFLLLASVFQNQNDFTKDFVHKIEKHTPFRFSFINKKKTEMEPLRQVLLEKADAYKANGFEL
mgnify:CR=1 FL=1